MIANRETFLSGKRKTVTVDLPDLGMQVNILKGTWATLQAVQKLKEDQVPEQIALILVDEEGRQLLTSPEDIAKVSELLTLTDMNLILDKWREVNGLTKAQLEETSKNSNASTTDASASA